MKVIWVYYLPSINTYKFMSGCLYIYKNLEDIKNYLQVHVISCKIFSQ